MRNYRISEFDPLLPFANPEEGRIKGVKFRVIGQKTFLAEAKAFFAIFWSFVLA